MTGIVLPAGVHEVRLAFRPRSVYIGAGLTIAAFGVWIVLVAKRLL